MNSAPDSSSVPANMRPFKTWQWILGGLAAIVGLELGRWTGITLFVPLALTAGMIGRTD